MKPWHMVLGVILAGGLGAVSLWAQMPLLQAILDMLILISSRMG